MRAPVTRWAGGVLSVVPARGRAAAHHDIEDHGGQSAGRLPVLWDRPGIRRLDVGHERRPADRECMDDDAGEPSRRARIRIAPGTDAIRPRLSLPPAYARVHGGGDEIRNRARKTNPIGHFLSM